MSMWTDVAKPTQFGIQARAEVLSPLDFSFMQIKNVKDIEKEDPRMPGSESHKVRRLENGHWHSQSLKLNNNSLSDMVDLPAAVELVFDSLEQLSWLDLSCNEITKISDVILRFPNLRVLNLHGNQIASLGEVDKLACLPSLKKLTLHGNKIEREKGYFPYIVGVVTTLISLDFTPITKNDRATATAFRTMVFGNKKGKRKRND